MRRFIVLVAALVLFAEGCSTAEPRLNSERIASKFGNYGVEVIAYDDGVRFANLYSMHGGTRVCRTFAAVRFSPAALHRVASEHEQVLAGGSIGETFKASGWRVSKRTRYIGELELTTDRHGLTRLMQLRGDGRLAMHVYRLRVRKNSEDIEYATIIEVHHPDFLDLRQLRALYAVGPDSTPTGTELADWQWLVAAR